MLLSILSVSIIEVHVFMNSVLCVDSCFRWRRCRRRCSRTTIKRWKCMY